MRLYLTLAALTTLAVGGIGVGNAVLAYLAAKRNTIAILKSLGASQRAVLAVYAGEIAILGFMVEQPFLRAALDWLGIKPQVSKRKEFKGAPYLFTETAMPAPLRQNLQQLTDSWL